MTLQPAIAFLSAARRDEALRAEVDALGDDVTAESLVALAGRAGFEFSAEDLQRAHALDWRMRWARYGGTQHSPDGPAHRDGLH